MSKGEPSHNDGRSEAEGEKPLETGKTSEIKPIVLEAGKRAAEKRRQRFRHKANTVLTDESLQVKQCEYQWLRQLEFSRMPCGSPEQVAESVDRIQGVYNQNLISTEAMVEYYRGDATKLREAITKGGFLNEFNRGGRGSVRSQIEHDMLNEPNYYVFQLQDPSNNGETVFYFSLYAPIESDGAWGTCKARGQSESGAACKYTNQLQTHFQKMHWESEYVRGQVEGNAENIVFVDTVGVSPDCIGKGVGTYGSYCVTQWLANALPANLCDVLSFRFKRIIPLVDGKPISGSEREKRDLVRSSENLPSAGLFKGFEKVGVHTDQAYMAREHDGREYLYEIEWLNESMELDKWYAQTRERVAQRAERCQLEFEA